MDAPTPSRKPTDLAELIFAPLGEPNPQVLAQLAELIRTAAEQARKQGEPKINPKKWEPADPDAAPTPLAEAVHQAEDTIRDLAAASLPRAKELAEQLRQPEKRKARGFWSRVRVAVLRLFGRTERPTEKKDALDAQKRAAEEKLKQVVAKLMGTGIAVTAEATETAPVQK